MKAFVVAIVVALLGGCSSMATSERGGTPRDPAADLYRGGGR